MGAAGRADVLGVGRAGAATGRRAAPGYYGQTSEGITGGQRLPRGILLQLGPPPPVVLHR